MNLSETAGMNRTSNIGLLNMLYVGTDFMTHVVGKMTEYIQGNKESHTDKDRLRVANRKITNQSEGVFEQHSQKEIKNNSAEISKNH